MTPELSTPYLVVDEPALHANIARVHARLDQMGIAARPHVKTHKCLEIARLQLGQGATGITVATVGEAEIFADAGCRDIFIAYPLWVDDSRADRLRRLADHCRLALGADSVAGVGRLSEHLDPRIDVLLEIDSGHQRSGCVPDEAAEIAKAVVDSGLTYRGLFTFPGHSYAPGAAAEVAREEAAALERAAESTRAAGLPASVISGGSTPSVGCMTGDVVTEARPGVYVFNDAQQWELDRCSPEQIALTAYGRVVNSRSSRVVLDSGSKVLGADRAGYATGYGRLLDHPDSRIVQLSEHHAVVELGPDDRLDLGDVVRVVPNHVCNAVNLVDELTVIADGDPARTWRVAARGANT